jgi:hypothetical protein
MHHINPQHRGISINRGVNPGYTSSLVPPDHFFPRKFSFKVLQTLQYLKKAKLVATDRGRQLRIRVFRCSKMEISKTGISIIKNDEYFKIYHDIFVLAVGNLPRLYTLVVTKSSTDFVISRCGI